ncbi:hypothetical protein TraAM80_01122 [Trypanosoma rangeli]|uniref:Uncharacterized protein n=1 Tax=Trypanosoma rangeli TaxID=5698 RepID=A0A3R7LBS4_TRYRA|nr:uncharacterized protein TraAM80_01122 [Trypanosoma rangeli]RNF11190.1 hypothetical protein TraAM80_01122 [Trypanosoma rangeli]|eukprot:RNF11190.1 hypothetical protein TraAM80_01122 [Trypanosoma rangeli]
MREVGAGECNEHERDQQRMGEQQQSPFCFSVKFDADPAEVGDSVFRGAHTFRSPAEVLVPLRMPLKAAAVSDLLSSFLFRTLCRFPHLSTRTVEAFFISAEGNYVTPRAGLGRPHLLRLDACMNRDDKLDNFFTPVTTHGRNVYEVIAHWASPDLKDATSNSTSLGKMKADEDGEASSLDADLVNALPVPVIYPFASRCTYAKLPPREASPEVNECSSTDRLEAPLPAVFVVLEKREAARKVRSVLEGEEGGARDSILGDERRDRAMIAEMEDEGRQQALAVLRLMGVDVPECGAKHTASPAPKQRRFLDTEPLASFPSSVYMKKLAQRAEETAWLSYIFAKGPVSGPALAAAKGKKNLGTCPQPDGVNSAGVKGDIQVTIEASETWQKLIQHYADVRCDLLLWERQSFRSLTTEMRNILEKQKQLDAEIVRRAFLDEMDRASVLEFGSYVHHYDQGCLCEELSGTPDTTANCISDASKDANSETSSTIMRYLKSPQSPVMQEGAVTITAATRDTSAKDSASPPMPVPRSTSSRSMLAEDAYFCEALERSKACAKAALDTIALIDMRYYEPVSFKLAKHRLSFDEKEARDVFIAEEGEGWKKLLLCFQQGEVELETNAYLALQRVFEPVNTAEEEARTALDVQQQRHMTLLLSLCHLGMRRLEMI